MKPWISPSAAQKKKKKREKRKKSLHGSKIDAVICFPFHKWSNKENNDSQ
jgi:hypothetical protein